MTIVVPRYVIVALGAVFSGYILVLAFSSFAVVHYSPVYLLAMGLYALATVVALAAPARRMPRLVAIALVLVAAVLPLLVASQLESTHPIGSDYATWYVGGIGTLMVIVSARGHILLAWLGVFVLVVHSVLWFGPGSLGALGVFGSVLWVAVSHMLQRSLAKAARDARAFALAEREAAEWHAAQEAHLFERQFRLGQTGRMALPMLRHIVATAGALTAGQRRECVYLEAGIRDEIRGRSLLDAAVREQVVTARRRGGTVTLLDEGGLDDMPEGELARVHGAIAAAIRGSRAETIIVRTVPEGSSTAVTVVGLAASGVNLLGQSGEEDDEPGIELWMEIPRWAEGAAPTRGAEARKR